jgi:hypothetical protein
MLIEGHNLQCAGEKGRGGERMGREDDRVKVYLPNKVAPQQYSLKGRERDRRETPLYELHQNFTPQIGVQNFTLLLLPFIIPSFHLPPLLWSTVLNTFLPSSFILEANYAVYSKLTN